MLNQSFKFKGGAWIGYISATWPFGKLEVSPDQLVIAIEGLPFSSSKIEHRFTHYEIEKIEIKKYFPIIAYGIHIIAKDKKIGNLLFFWYVSFRFKNLVSALRACSWI